MIVDTEAAMRFLRTAYEPDDWIALFLKSYETGQHRAARRPAVAVPRTARPRLAAGDERPAVQRLRQRERYQARRPRADEGRHRRRPSMFLEADDDGAAASWRSSPDRATSRRHPTSSNRRRIGFTCSGAWPASRPKRSSACRSTWPPSSARTRPRRACSQTTRLAWLSQSQARSVASRDDRVQAIASAPLHAAALSDAAHPRRPSQPSRPPRDGPQNPLDVVERARRYLARVEPAVAGQHGDLHTFRVCCRIVRGFALSDDDALAVLTRVERPLRAAVERARAARQDSAALAEYGREPIGALLNPSRPIDSTRCPAEGGELNAPRPRRRDESG